MLDKHNRYAMSGTMILLLVFVNAIVLKFAFVHNEQYYMALIITFPLLLMAVYNAWRKKLEILK